MNIKSWLRTSSLTDRHTGRLLALLIVSAMALTACFGGGSAGGNLLQNRISAPEASKKAADAATRGAMNRPQKSSTGIAQSSHTGDKIVATASYTEAVLSITVMNELESSSWGTASFSTAVPSTNQLLLGSLETLLKDDDDDDDEVKFSRSTLEKRVDGGIVYFDVYTDLQAPPSVDTDTDTDSDYLVGGVWLFIPDNLESRSGSGEDAGPGLEIGAFMDGSTLTPSAYLHTASLTAPTANYLGKAAGLLLGAPVGAPIGATVEAPIGATVEAPIGAPNTADTTVGSFEATVTLAATFKPTAPVISGTVSGFEFAEGFGGQLESDEEEDPIISFTLRETMITSDNEGGFFTGDTSGSYTERSSEGNGMPVSISGEWGGQFYGEAADKVGGTFGGSATSSSYKLGFVGVFAAGKRRGVTQ